MDLEASTISCRKTKSGCFRRMVCSTLVVRSSRSLLSKPSVFHESSFRELQEEVWREEERERGEMYSDCRSTAYGEHVNSSCPVQNTKSDPHSACLADCTVPATAPLLCHPRAAYKKSREFRLRRRPCSSLCACAGEHDRWSWRGAER